MLIVVLLLCLATSVYVALRRKDGQDYLVVLNYLKEPQEIVLQEPMVDLDTRCDVEGPVVLGSYETKVYRVKF